MVRVFICSVSSLTLTTMPMTRQTQGSNKKGEITFGLSSLENEKQIALGEMKYPLSWWYVYMHSSKSWGCRNSKNCKEDCFLTRSPWLRVYKSLLLWLNCHGCHAVDFSSQTFPFSSLQVWSISHVSNFFDIWSIVLITIFMTTNLNICVNSGMVDFLLMMDDIWKYEFLWMNLWIHNFMNFILFWIFWYLEK